MIQALNDVGASMLFSIFAPIIGSLAIWAAEVWRSYREWVRYQNKLENMFLQERINRLGGGHYA